MTGGHRGIRLTVEHLGRSLRHAHPAIISEVNCKLVSVWLIKCKEKTFRSFDVAQ